MKYKLILINIFKVPSYSCTRGHCGPIYHHFLIGSEADVAIACSKSSKCSAFQFSKRNKGGSLCSRSEIVLSQSNTTSEPDDLRICSLDSGND